MQPVDQKPWQVILVAVPGQRIDTWTAWAPGGITTADLTDVATVVCGAGNRSILATHCTMPVDLSRIDVGFPRTVYETLQREVGWGETVSYGELAEMAGRPRAARAVGNAMSRNPVPIVVPCHRVVAAGGRIGGYGPSGVPTKRFLLALEGVELPT